MVFHCSQRDSKSFQLLMSFLKILADLNKAFCMVNFLSLVQFLEEHFLNPVMLSFLLLLRKFAAFTYVINVLTLSTNNQHFLIRWVLSVLVLIKSVESSYSVEINVLYCDIRVSGFEPKSHYYVHFQINILRKGWNVPGSYLRGAYDKFPDLFSYGHLILS